MQLRKIVKNRGHFPSDEATTKLLYLALRNIEKDWKMPPIMPLKRAGFPIADSAFENKKSYSDWRFVCMPSS